MATRPRKLLAVYDDEDEKGFESASTLPSSSTFGRRSSTLYKPAKPTTPFNHENEDPFIASSTEPTLKGPGNKVRKPLDFKLSNVAPATITSKRSALKPKKVANNVKVKASMEEYKDMFGGRIPFGPASPEPDEQAQSTVSSRFSSCEDMKSPSPPRSYRDRSSSASSDASSSSSGMSMANKATFGRKRGEMASLALKKMQAMSTATEDIEDEDVLIESGNSRAGGEMDDIEEGDGFEDGDVTVRPADGQDDERGDPTLHISTFISGSSSQPSNGQPSGSSVSQNASTPSPASSSFPSGKAYINGSPSTWSDISSSSSRKSHSKTEINRRARALTESPLAEVTEAYTGQGGFSVLPSPLNSFAGADRGLKKRAKGISSGSSDCESTIGAGNGYAGAEGRKDRKRLCLIEDSENDLPLDLDVALDSDAESVLDVIPNADIFSHHVSVDSQTSSPASSIFSARSVNSEFLDSGFSSRTSSISPSSSGSLSPLKRSSNKVLQNSRREEAAPYPSKAPMKRTAANGRSKAKPLKVFCDLDDKENQEDYVPSACIPSTRAGKRDNLKGLGSGWPSTSSSSAAFSEKGAVRKTAVGMNGLERKLGSLRM